jgi:hypothetical protein
MAAASRFGEMLTLFQTARMRPRMRQMYTTERSACKQNFYQLALLSLPLLSADFGGCYTLMLLTADEE